MSLPSASREIVQKRALMRAEHRGTKEMDLILGRFARARLSAMSEGELAEFEELLALDDHDLHQAITKGEVEAGSNMARYQGLIAKIRVFLLGEEFLPAKEEGGKPGA